jgi:hypothetical protein
MEAVSWGGCRRRPTPRGEVRGRGRGFGDCCWRSWDGLRFAKRYAAEGGGGGEVAVIVDVSAVIAQGTCCEVGGEKKGNGGWTGRVHGGRGEGEGGESEGGWRI